MFRLPKLSLLSKLIFNVLNAVDPTDESPPGSCTSGAAADGLWSRVYTSTQLYFLRWTKLKLKYNILIGFHFFSFSRRVTESRSAEDQPRWQLPLYFPFSDWAVRSDESDTHTNIHTHTHTHSPPAVRVGLDAARPTCPTDDVFITSAGRRPGPAIETLGAVTEGGNTQAKQYKQKYIQEDDAHTHTRICTDRGLARVGVRRWTAFEPATSVTHPYWWRGIALAHKHIASASTAWPQGL